MLMVRIGPPSKLSLLSLVQLGGDWQWTYLTESRTASRAGGRLTHWSVFRWINGSIALGSLGQLLHLAVVDRISEVDDQADQQPGDHHLPGDQREIAHQVAGGENAKDGHNRNKRSLEGPVQLRISDPQHPDAGANDGEGQQ